MGGIGTGPGETAMARAQARLPLNNRPERAPTPGPRGFTVAVQALRRRLAETRAAEA